MLKINIYFILSITVIFLLKISTDAYQNSLLFNVEIWAETGTNFYLNALEGFLSSIFKTDAGYLVLFQRIIASSYWLFFHTSEYFFEYCAWISLAFIVGSCAFVNLSINKVFIESNLVRFLLSICLSFVKDYELHTFVNFAYFSWIPLFLLAINPNINQLSSTKKSLIFIFCSLAILSKGVFVILLPLIMILIIFTKSIKKWSLQSALIIPLAIQCFFLFITQLNIKKSHSFSNGYALDLIWTTASSLLLNTARTLFYHHSDAWIQIIFLSLFIFLIYKKKIFNIMSSHQKIVVASSLIIFTLNHILILIASKNLITHFPTIPIDIIEGRAFYVGVVSIFIGATICADSLRTSMASKSAWIYLALLFIWSVFKPTLAFDDLKVPGTKNYSQNYKLLLDKDRICLPINPYSWYLLKNCSELYSPQPFSDVEHITQTGIYQIKTPITYEKVYLLAVHTHTSMGLKVITKGNTELLERQISSNNINYYSSKNGITSESILLFYDDKKTIYLDQKPIPLKMAILLGI